MNRPVAGGVMFARRRRRLLRRLAGGVAVLTAAPVASYSRDISYPFRQDSDFFYLTGLAEPEVVAVLAPGERRGRFWLFIRPRDPDREVWEGPRAGLDEAREIYGADVSRPLEELGATLEELLAGARTLHYSGGGHRRIDRIVRRSVRRVRSRRRGLEVTELSSLIHSMRLTKGDGELRTLRRAARITCDAHRLAMGVVAPGRFEYEIEAVLEGEFLRQGASGPAYPSIVASGPNACILHSDRNRRRMRSGDLVLIDAGCEFDYYSADVTRTVAVNGRFTPAQRDIYDLVLAAQEEAIATVRPGRRFVDPHQVASRVLAAGLVRLGLMQGSATEIFESGRHRRYSLHRTSHWLGIDVHDVGPSGKDVRLRPGMVLTIEPGLYFPPDDRDIPARYRGIGVRIEDDVQVTAGGRTVLTAAIPKQPHALERLVGTGVSSRSRS
ncbi:MAG: aminopeptidase P N-terminal domain-containing protein [Acidobacteriota bacterium]